MERFTAQLRSRIDRNQRTLGRNLNFLMYLSNPKRIYLVLEYLIKHPRRAADYFRHCCFSKSPLEKGLPWWSYEAIDWVSKNLNTIHSVFEWGSGGSTIFLSPLCKKVLSIENDLKWHRMVINEVERLSIQNVTILKEKSIFLVWRHSKVRLS